MKRMILGAIAGDVIGSCYEARLRRTKRTDFELFSKYSRFTDDTVLTVATMACLLSEKLDYADYYSVFAKRYPDAGYGGAFRQNFLYAEKPQPYNSFGNGSGMRVSPVGWYCQTLEEVLAEAERSAAVSHNHSEGVKGAKAIAASVFLARTGKSKDEIRKYVEAAFGYDLQRTCDDIRPDYSFDSTCQGSVPEAIIAFLDSTDYESAVRLAVSLGGDSDTLAAMAGGITEAFYGSVPEDIVEEVIRRLPDEFLDVIRRF